MWGTTIRVRPGINISLRLQNDLIGNPKEKVSRLEFSSKAPCCAGLLCKGSLLQGLQAGCHLVAQSEDQWDNSFHQPTHTNIHMHGDLLAPNPDVEGVCLRSFCFIPCSQPGPEVNGTASVLTTKPASRVTESV